MAIDLKAVFRVQDNGTSKLRKIMQQTDRLNKSTQQSSKASDKFRDSQSRLSGAMGRFTSDSNRATSASRRFATSLGGLRVGASGVGGSLQGLQSALFGIAGAYLSAQGAASAFNATIGAAARYEQSEVAVQAIFNDKSASDAYLKMVDKMAIDSPLLNSGEMLGASKTLVAMTKDVGDLGKAWSIIERLMVLDPTQGTDGAAFALKEMWQGDALSMVERFGLSKKDLNRIKKLDIPQQIAEINKLLDGMGITQSTVNAMGETTLGYWAQIQERADKFMRTIGGDGNSKLGDSLGKIVAMLDNTDLDSVAGKLGDKLGTIVDKAIEVGKWLWKWREPVAYIVGALTAATSAFMIIGAVSLLANPIALIGAGVAALVVGFKALYENSDAFRGAIDGLIGKARELWSAFKTDGAGGVLDSLFGEGTAEKVSGIIDKVKTKFGELQGGFNTVKDALSQGWTVVSDIFTSAWTIIEPILSGLWSILQVVGDYASIAFENIIAPALSFVTQLFSTLWAIAQPILIILGGLFEVLGAIIKWVWDNVLSPLVEFIAKGFKNAFDNLGGVLETVSSWFEKLGGWANTAKDYLSQFADVISGIKLPDWVTSGISTVVTTVGKAIGAGSAKSHYHGLDNVPYDGYNARLHKGERVLTAQENKEFSSNGGLGGGLSIAKLADQIIVREDTDIDRIAMAIVKQIERERLQRG